MDVPDRVRRTYDLMHTNQTVESVKQRTEKWCKFNHAELTVMEALLMLDNLVDESDPDVSHLYLQRMLIYDDIHIKAIMTVQQCIMCI